MTGVVVAGSCHRRGPAPSDHGAAASNPLWKQPMNDFPRAINKSMPKLVWHESSDGRVGIS